MLLSLNWLREFVEFNVSPEELADLLTRAGLEVEGVYESKYFIDSVVVGKIKDVVPHPNSDHLTICTVDDGDSLRKVVCGAPNVAVGINSALALEGSIIHGNIKIDKREVRGVLSEGMLCSEKELGLSDDHSGIIVLEDDLMPGTPLTDIIPKKDIILEVALTPNRGDCLSILGIAREVSALLNIPLNIPPIELKEENELVTELASVEIEAPDACPRYVARMVKDIKLLPSPLWMRQRLLASGLRPINNVVDITNYILMEYGQPLHAFDFHTLSHGKIVVRHPREGEKYITTLDGVERRIYGDTLLICDAEVPVAIAGVMGGAETEISETTKDVLIESAFFSPSSIRKTSRKLGLSTEASYRFERGTDPDGVIRAANRAAELMARYASGKILKGIIDIYPKKITPKDIRISAKKTNQILGTSLQDNEVKGYLSRLMIKIEESDEGFIATPPSFRHDLERDIDLIEEVARLYGYGNIPIDLPGAPIFPEAPSKIEEVVSRVRDSLYYMGVHEIITYSFISKDDIKAIGYKEGDHRFSFVRLLNPLDQNRAVMRTTLVPGVLQTLLHNINQRQDELKLFEIGRVFFATDEKNETLPEERLELVISVAGRAAPLSWWNKERKVDFYDLKGIVEALLIDLRVGELEFVPCDKTSSNLPPFLVPEESIFIKKDERNIGIVGPLRSSILQKFEIEVPVYLAEIYIEDSIEVFFQPKTFQSLPKFPFSERDIAIVVDSSIRYCDILKVIRDEGAPYLEGVYLFDVYTGKQIPKGSKSLAFRLIFRAQDRTLTDEDVNAQIDKIIRVLQDKFEASLRS